MSLAPSTRLTAMLRQEFQMVGLVGGDPARAALERAEFVQQLMYLLYDEIKFRLGDRTEIESLGCVSDTAMEHWHRMRDRVEDGKPGQRTNRANPPGGTST